MCSGAFALSTDRDQPTQIEADRVDVDDKKGISTFRGNVKLTRGSILMTADKVKVYRDKNKDVDKILAWGNPVRYKQRPDKRKEDVIAQAKKVEYNAVKGKLILQDSARIRQGKDIFTGSRIVYDINRDVVRASKAPAGKERVQITIQPKKK